MDMSSKIIYAHTICHYCHTTEHSFSKCTKRGCRFCKGKHKVEKCHLRCPCEKGNIHKKENCRWGNNQAEGQTSSKSKEKSPSDSSISLNVRMMCDPFFMPESNPYRDLSG